MISESDLLAEIAAALEIDCAGLTIDSMSSDIEQWDSLGHITILTRLDEMFENVTEQAPSLAEAMSVREIWNILNSLKDN